MNAVLVGDRRLYEWLFVWGLDVARCQGEKMKYVPTYPIQLLNQLNQNTYHQLTPHTK